MDKFRGAVFDLDGTLIDSMGVWAKIDAAFFEKRGMDMPPDYTQAVKIMGFSQAARYTVARFSLPDTPEDVCAEWMRMAQDAYEHELPAKPLAREYLAHLKGRGVLLGLATANHAYLYEPVLRRLGLFEFFDACVSTSDVGAGKESPAVFLEAARRLGLRAADCVAFEDTLGGVRCAKAAGMRAVCVHDPWSEGDRGRLLCEADLCVENFAELLRRAGAPESADTSGSDPDA